MPIHSAGYRGWDGDRVSDGTRWTVIASTGVRRAWKSNWLRRMLVFSLLPIVVMVTPLFLFEQAIRNPVVWREVVGMLQGLPETQRIADTLALDPGTASDEQIQDARHRIWTYLLLTMFRTSQAFLMVLVIGITTPPLIADDVRTRAFLIYFSRPITRLEYVVGKMGTTVFFLLLVTTVPAMLFYFAGIMLSPTPTVLLGTWDLPLRILLASATLILPTTSLALMFSSMTGESRYAGFAWFAVWILGYATYTVVTGFTVAYSDNFERDLLTPGWRALVSPYHMLGVVQTHVFGLTTEESVLAPAAIVLTLVTVVSLAVLYRRVSAPMRV